MLVERDRRVWAMTELEGERVSVGRPVPGCELLSATGSTRCWSQPVHEGFTVAAVHGGLPPTATQWRSRGRTVITAGGELMAINAGDGHATLRVHAPAAFDAVSLTGERIDDAARAAGLRGSFWLRSPACSSARVFAAVRAFVTVVARGDEPLFVEAACHDLANAIVTDLGETQPDTLCRSRSAPDPRLRRARECLDDMAGENRPSLLDVANEAGLGRSQLCALFKDYYGVSITQYGLTVRVAKAKARLLEGTPVKDVAADLGFTDQAHFSRHFRRRHGLAPGAWVSL